MGGCSVGKELPAATGSELKALQERGHLPCVATPSADFDGKNQLQTVYVAAYENGTELTFSFLDEDWPNACADCVYDTIRWPLYGRVSDIESLIIVNDQVHFPGTYSADQSWGIAMPTHNEASIDLSEFEKNDAGELILWINTWNHLFGEKNNNATLPITYQCAQTPGGVESMETEDFVIRKGSRDEVDARFKGLMTSKVKVMTPERRQELGRRLF